MKIRINFCFKEEKWKTAGLFLLLMIPCLQRSYSSNLSGRISDYSDHYLAEEEFLSKIKESGNFMGRKTPGSGGTIGWFEYDVEVDTAGWYELLIRYDSNVFNEGWSCHLTEYSVDGRPLFDYPYMVAIGQKKVGNIWMDKGKHKFRFGNINWWSRAPITGYQFKLLKTSLSQNIRIDLEPKDDYYGGNYYAVGESFPVNIYSAGKAQGIFTMDVVRESDRSVVKTYNLTVSPSTIEKKQTIQMSVNEAGSFYCRYLADGKSIPKWEGLRGIRFTAIDASPAEIPESERDVPKRLLQTIDCTSQSPDYQDAVSRVVSGGPGKYRETGNSDWDYYAYKLPVIHSGRPYIVEVDVPDDRQRAIQIQFRERDPVNYIIGPGIETGIPYKNSGRFITQRYLFWPRFDGEQPRIAIVNVGHNDHSAPAAVKEIRLYQTDGQLPALKKRENGREFCNWFEEPLRWLDPFGARDKSTEQQIGSAENWAKTMRYMGITTMFVTADVYGGGMYPSAYRYSSKYSGDPFKLILLVAEKYGLKVIADFSPKYGVLTTKHYNDPAPERFNVFMYDKNGNHYDYLHKSFYGAFFNPAYPEVRQEIKKKLAEFAGRYKGSPALKGACIRIMTWQPHTMTSFQSLDWGYGPYTGKIFSEYLGIPDPGTPQKRYALFTGQYRDQWIDWRIHIVHETLREVVDTCRLTNPGFNLYSTVSSSWAGKEQAAEAGIDNFSTDGFSYVNGFYSPGRKGKWQDRRRNLTDPGILSQFDASRANFFGFQYFEDGRKNIPNSALGLSGDDSKWISALLNPVGDQALEAYALALAQTDVIFMGDGGNTYFIEPSVVREFLADYVVLPKDRFSTVFSGPEVVVRDLKGSDYLFYVVNKTDQKQQVVLEFCNKGKITRLATGKTYTTGQNNKISLKLAPFHLLSFKNSGTTVCSVSVTEK